MMYFTQQRIKIRQAVDHAKSEYFPLCLHADENSDIKHQGFVDERLRKMKEFYTIRKQSYASRIISK